MKHRHVLIFILMFVGATLLGACSDSKRVAQVDMLNERSYDAHYRSLAQTRAYALQALKLSKGYDAGVAESYNNLAFVCLAKMNYGRAEEFLRYAAGVSDNLVEQLVAYVQFMRLCQRKSKNKDFYTYMQLASQLMSPTLAHRPERRGGKGHGAAAQLLLQHWLRRNLKRRHSRNNMPGRVQLSHALLSPLATV